MRVASIIVNTNDGEVLPICLETLLSTRHPSHEIVVVDNGSSDGSVEFARNRFPDVQFLELGENLGYGAALNKGVAYATDRADAFFLLNPDTLVDPACIENLVLALKEGPDIGVAGPWIYDPEKPNRLLAAGSSLHHWTLLVDHQVVPYDQITDVPYVTGCAFLVTKDAWQRIGPLDESYFIYYEEVDYCFRSRQKGYRVVAVPSAKLWHKDVWDRWSHSPLQVYFVQRNRIRFLRKHGTTLQTAFYAGYLPAVHFPFKFLELTLVYKSLKGFLLYIRALVDGVFTDEPRPGSHESVILGR